MNREEFLTELRRCLAQMPEAERERQLAYYDELLSDMLEDGMTEAEAVERLGSPAKIAQELLTELPLSTLVKTRMRSAGKPSALNIVLLVLGFPLWFPLLLAFAAILLSVVVVLWALVLSFGAVVLALGLTALAAPIALFLDAAAASPLLFIGAALVAGGLCVLGFLALRPLCRGMVKLCGQIGKWIKSWFIKRRAEG